MVEIDRLSNLYVALPTDSIDQTEARSDAKCCDICFASHHDGFVLDFRVFDANIGKYFVPGGNELDFHPGKLVSGMWIQN